MMPAEDPALVERFFMEILDFRPAELAITDPVHPELLGTWIYCAECVHDIAFIKGPAASCTT
jgi:catechol 2,3-dioxygenase